MQGNLILEDINNFFIRVGDAFCLILGQEVVFLESINHDYTL